MCLETAALILSVNDSLIPNDHQPVTALININIVRNVAFWRQDPKSPIKVIPALSERRSLDDKRKSWDSLSSPYC
jgi:hypothetical protein